MAVDDGREPLVYAFKACLAHLPRIVKHLGVDLARTQLYAMPVVGFTTTRGARASTSERLLKKLGFSKCGDTKQNFPLYQAKLAYVLERLADGNYRGKRPNSRQRKS
jgi:hypothetical protein